MSRMLVLGAAVSGAAAARLGHRLGHHVTVYDQSPDALDASDLDPNGTGMRLVAGEWSASLLDDADLIVTSPGIPPSAEPLAAALRSGIPVMSELEFGARRLRAPYVAVTGTNGKTTVAEAAAAMMIADGMNACAAGNVGLAVSDVALDEWDAVAIEASSFQLELTATFHPKAAAVLNIAPDHLDWHGGFDGYAAAKLKIAANQGSDDVFVFDPDDEVTSALSERVVAMRVPVSGSRLPAGGNGPDDGCVWIAGRSYPKPKLDPVWLYDLAVAATLADSVGVGPLGIQTVLEAFEPGSHRRQIAGESGGVVWINDSKATNPHAAVAAAGSYDSVILIAGGRNKGLDLSPMLTVPSVRHVVALGEAAAELADLGGDGVSVVTDLAAAVDVSYELAEPGDTVLLAPGCASFDMFASYGERGERFMELVRAKLGGVT